MGVIRVVAGAEAFFAAFNLSTYLQAVAIATGLVVFIAVGRVKQKDAANADLETALAAKTERLKETEAHLEGASHRADEAETHARACSDEVIHWKAKYDEQERYTARGALEDVGERLASLQSTIVSAITNQGELILKNTELASAAVSALERVARDLEALEARLTR